MPPRRDDDLSADHIEQAGRMLMPAFREAIREENEDLIREHVAPLSARVAKLENVQAKAIAVYGIIATAVGLLGATVFNWLKKKIFGQ